ncbi:MAG: hypothetical protein IPN01_20515 [Deltaproteobacteria bacterium]|nr:hypothetical protein [Deltaproteobacteria bacterium]
MTHLHPTQSAHRVSAPAWPCALFALVLGCGGDLCGPFAADQAEHVGDLSFNFKEACKRVCDLRVTGDLRVDDTTLTDLDALSCVTEVEGSVFLLWGDHLTDVSGLDRLARVGGDLHLVGHGNNEPIKGFDGLTELGGHLIIAGFDGESIDAFNGLRHAEGGITLRYLSALTELGGFRSLESAGS